MISPFLENKDRGTSNRKIGINYGYTKDSQLLPGTIYYLGLHRPTIKGLYTIDKCDLWNVDELQNILL